MRSAGIDWRFSYLPCMVRIIFETTYMALPPKIRPVIQLALHDHHIADRTILSLSDSIKTYAAP